MGHGRAPSVLIPSETLRLTGLAARPGHPIRPHSRKFDVAALTMSGVVNPGEGRQHDPTRVRL
jgi:hypothetical protein